MSFLNGVPPRLIRAYYSSDWLFYLTMVVVMLMPAVVFGTVCWASQPVADWWVAQTEPGASGIRFGAVAVLFIISLFTAKYVEQEMEKQRDRLVAEEDVDGDGYW